MSHRTLTLTLKSLIPALKKKTQDKEKEYILVARFLNNIFAFLFEVNFFYVTLSLFPNGIFTFPYFFIS